jgi:hypothetical protein
LSFFDDADDPLTEQGTAPRRGRGSSGGRRPPTSGRRSASDQQAFMIRRAIGLTGIVVVVILIVLGVHSCEVSQRNSSLKDYSNSVATLIAKSNQTGKSLFNALSGASGASNATALQTQVNGFLQDTRSQLNQGKALDVPNEMRVAQQDLVLALQMRRDGVSNIAGQIQQALSKSASGDASKSIAAEMARLYGSDVVYTDYSAPAIVRALHGVGIFGQPIASGQFVTDIQWLQPTFVASKFGAALPGTQNGKPAPGIHGHAMQSVSVNGTALAQGGTNTLAANPPPTFTCTFTNDGQNNETNVTVKVSVGGTSISGQSVVPQTVPGHQYTAQVQLSSAPPAGSYTVTATIGKVPGETVTTHNTQTFQVTFH